MLYIESKCATASVHFASLCSLGGCVRRPTWRSPVLRYVCSMGKKEISKIFCRISEASLPERATAKDDMRKSYGSIDWSAVNMVELLVVHWVIDRCLQADGSRMWSRNKTFSGGEVSQSGRTSPSRYTTGCSLLGAVRLQIRYKPTHKP